MPGLQGKRAGQEASQLPLCSLCGYATASVMLTPVQACLGAETSKSLQSSTEQLDRVATGIEGLFLVQRRAHLCQDNSTRVTLEGFW